MSKKLNIIGNRYGKLTVISYEGIKKQRTLWKCKCDCGNIAIIVGYILTTGGTKSCGCLIHEGLQRKHSMCGTTEYYAWVNMKTRCYNTKVNDPDYIGNGITVCDRWINSFENFYEDMGKKPKGKYSIERLNSKGNYEPLNCIWGTEEQQCRNKKNNRWIEYNGLEMILQDWSAYLGAAQSNLYNCIKLRGFEGAYNYYLKKHGSLPANNKYSKKLFKDLIPAEQMRKINPHLLLDTL